MFNNDSNYHIVNSLIKVYCLMKSNYRLQCGSHVFRIYLTYIALSLVYSIIMTCVLYIPI